jgi:hypothetical protein
MKRIRSGEIKKEQERRDRWAGQDLEWFSRTTMEKNVLVLNSYTKMFNPNPELPSS